MQESDMESSGKITWRLILFGNLNALIEGCHLKDVFLSKVMYHSKGYLCDWVAQVKICELVHSQKNIFKKPTSGKSHLRRWYINWDSGTVYLVSLCEIVRKHVLCSYWPPIAPVFCPQTRCLSLVMPLKHWVICWPSKRNSSIELEKVLYFFIYSENENLKPPFEQHEIFSLLRPKFA